MADLTDSEAVIESVTAGDHDEYLSKLIEAIRLRFTFGTTRQKWEITYREGEEDELYVKEDDLTLGEARLVERITATDWGMMNPASTATECVTIIAVCLHTRQGKGLKLTSEGPTGDAWNEAAAIPAATAAGLISSYEVPRAPKS